MKLMLRIVNGPSKFDLSVALFHGDSQHRHKVTFKLEPFPGQPVQPVAAIRLKFISMTKEIVISQVQREDGSGEKWNIWGWDSNGVVVKGFYDTQARSGHMEFEEK